MPSPTQMTRINPRSATDATRFTSTTPHASSKHTTTTSSPPASASSSGSPAAAGNGSRRGNPMARGGETPEERVRRLRAAHEAARKAQVSGFDKAVGGGRRFFDFAHRFTVAGLIGFTAIAGLVSVYSVYDMVVYNRKRRGEFAEAQKRIAADSLATARLAFINGTATEAQVQLVEEANAAAQQSGTKLPPLLAPSPSSSSSSSHDSFPTSSLSQTQESTHPAEQPTKAKKSSWWPFTSNTASPPNPNPSISSDLLTDSAHTAFAKERAEQQLQSPKQPAGTETEGKKKGWW